jgi:hypothetical protein
VDPNVVAVRYHCALEVVTMIRLVRTLASSLALWRSLDTRLASFQVSL